MKKNYSIGVLLFAILLFPAFCHAAGWDTLSVPRLKYDGGGDWYTGPTSMINLMKEVNRRLKLLTQAENIAVSISDPELFRYPMLYLTGTAM